MDVEELAGAVPFEQELTMICKHITRLAVLPNRVRMELLVLIVRIHINAIAARDGRDQCVTTA